ncbi:GMC family oxidoreductase [Thalassotalea sp. G20_0]|nr:GMC family oxidoreductase [Thalassotalea sp. G20_0]
MMSTITINDMHYDYVIVGSGFGGSVSALRLSQKGYRVLVIEKGKWFKDHDYAKGSWNLSKWLWVPTIGFRGIMKLTILKHVTVYSGVGVGGGSLVYGATLPTPKDKFFSTGTWAKLEDWQQVLKPHYDEALRMLGATPNPNLTDADQVIQDLAKDIGKEKDFHNARVGVFFSDRQDKSDFVPDPYFDGEGPDRKPCIECASCMTGCRHNAKNTLDKNYLYLAQKSGADIISEQEVVDVRPLDKTNGKAGYEITFTSSRMLSSRKKQRVTANGVVFSGGVLGTVKLLLNLKHKKSLTNLSEVLGDHIRTNNETVTAVTSFKKDVDFARGVTIGSILHTDDNSHLEPISQNRRAGFMKLLNVPRVTGKNFLNRCLSLAKTMAVQPIKNLRVLLTPDWGKKTIYLLFMQQLNSTLSFQRGVGGIISSTTGIGEAPSCTIEESQALTSKVEKITEGKASSSSPEALLGTPTTAHILGGCVMGENRYTGVINNKGQVFGYENMYVCDGSAISANPGVNPSLSITAVSEWTMSHIPHKSA